MSKTLTELYNEIISLPDKKIECEIILKDSAHTTCKSIYEKYKEKISKKEPISKTEFYNTMRIFSIILNQLKK